MHVLYCLVIYLLQSLAAEAHPLPRILQNTEMCPLNACEIMKIFSEHYLLPNMGPAEVKIEKLQKEHYERIASSRQLSIEQRVREVERRLRSVEQPIWKIVKIDEMAWDCRGEGICRCQAVTKSLSCWRTQLTHLPVVQDVPIDINAM
jgi:hypothetical protein